VLTMLDREAAGAESGAPRADACPTEATTPSEAAVYPPADARAALVLIGPDGAEVCLLRCSNTVFAALENKARRGKSWHDYLEMVVSAETEELLYVEKERVIPYVERVAGGLAGSGKGKVQP